MINKKEIYAVILAGGSGARFWPLSTPDRPKQFLKIIGDKSLFEMTLKRISSIVPINNIYIVTNKRLSKELKKQTTEIKIPYNNLLYEPKGKNTAPAICWAAAVIAKKNPRALMMVLPSDHLIQNPNKFNLVIKQALLWAQKDKLVTLGIKPIRPETGYGYLLTARLGSSLKVKKFVEKPSLVKAAQYIINKNYLWNSGMFVWKASTILQAMKQYLPKIYRLIINTQNVNTVWNKLPSISVDYGILEKAKNVVAVSGENLGWSDLGSFESLLEVLPKDKSGSNFKGRVINIGSARNLVWGEKKYIAAVGIEDMIIVDTKNALLVCRKDQSQKVKEIIPALNDK